MSYGMRITDRDLSTDLKEVKDNCEVKLRPDNVPRKPVTISLGPHLEGCAPVRVDVSDPLTQASGVLKRVARKPPEVDPDLVQEFVDFSAGLISQVPRLTFLSELSVEEWLEKTNYPQWRKDELLRHADKIFNVEDNQVRMNKCFIKREGYTEFKWARIIMSRSDEFKTELGPIVKLVEEVCYSEDVFGKYFIKHCTPPQIAEKMMKKFKGLTGIKFLETDYTSFESLFRSEILLAVEVRFILHVLTNTRAYKKAARCGKVISEMNKMVMSTLVAYVQARMSGEMTTSFGNGLTNLFLMLFAAYKSGAKVDGFVEGDDGLFAELSGKFDETIFSHLGFIIKLIRHPSLETSAFCGTVLDWEGDPLPLTDPIRFLVRLGWAEQQYMFSSLRKRHALLKCKCLSYAHQYVACPIVSLLARHYVALLKDVTFFECLKLVNSFKGDQYQREYLRDALDGEVPDYVEPSLRSRFIVQERFGITVDHQIQFERAVIPHLDLGPIPMELIPFELPDHCKLF